MDYRIDAQPSPHPAPDRLWVVDLTYFRTWSGFIKGAYSRANGRPTRHRAPCIPTRVPTASEQALWARHGPFTGLEHHSIRASNTVPSDTTKPLAEAYIASSVGSRGDPPTITQAVTASGLSKVRTGVLA